MAPIAKPPLLRFMSLLFIGQIGGHWFWQGSMRNANLKGRKKTYGQFKLPDGRTVDARRFAYTLCYGGNLPTQHTLLTRCGAWRCVNPEHMELVTIGQAISEGQKPL